MTFMRSGQLLPPRIWGTGFISLLFSTNVGGVLIRRLLPAAVLVPSLLGWIRLWGQRQGFYGLEFGLSMMIALNITIYTALIWRISSTLHKEDRRRRHAEELFRLAINASTNSFFMADARGTIVLLNEQLERTLMYPHDELLGQSSDVLVPERHRAAYRRIREGFAERPANPQTGTEEEFPALRRDGSEIPIEIRFKSARLDGSTFVLASIIDVSARKDVEVRFLATFEQAAVGIAHVSPVGRWLRVNQKLCDILGYTSTELLAQTFQSITHPDDLQAGEACLRQMLGGAMQAHSYEKRYFRKDGSVVWINLTLSLVRTPAGAPDYFISVLEDISRRRQAEDTLLRAEARLRSLSDANPIGIVVGDPRGNIFDVNPAILNLLGYTREEILSGRKSWTEITPPEYRELDARALAKVMSTGVATPWEKEYISKDGRRIPVLVGVSRIQESADTCIAFVLDLSERKRLEDELRQAQRMEMIGRLAGGVAHDFNNLLTPIIGYSALILARLSEDDPSYEELTEVQRAGQRAAMLTRQLLAFSRKQVLQPKATNLSTLATEAAKLLGPLLREDVRLVLALADTVRPVKVDSAQIEQVLVNLADNARDAMPHGGTLTIETATVELSEEYARAHSDATAGQYTLLAVSDTGSGISPEIIAHLFEPFFTTKERGRGTGLGLATVHGIVKQSQGHIGVCSELGRGTTFKLYFPVCDQEPARELAEAPAPPPQNCGSETILLVEDEEALRTLAAKVLRSNLYEVLEAENGESALALGMSCPGSIDLLITDIVMPGMSGQEVARQVATTHPWIKVLYMSGYAEDSIVHHGVLDPGTELLEKPFTPEVLERRVRGLLGGLKQLPAMTAAG